MRLASPSTAVRDNAVAPPLMVVGVKLFVAILVVLLATTTCSKEFEDSRRGESLTAGMTIEEVLKQHTHRLMSLPGVVGTAIGECQGKPCIKVLVVKKSPELLNKIPSTLEGIPVAVEETGPFRALDRG